MIRSPGSLWARLECPCGATALVPVPDLRKLAVSCLDYPCAGCGGVERIDWVEELMLHGDPYAPEPRGVLVGP